MLTSAKRDFLAGGDLDQLRRVAAPADAIAIVTPFLKALRKLETGGKPVVAALNGTALGGGFELALACHRRIAADVASARFGLPEVTLGLMPGGGGTQRLPRLIGIAAAAPLLLEGKRLKPADALAAGIIDEVVAADELRARAKAWALANPNAAQPWDVKGYKLPGFAPQSAEGRMFFMGSWTRLHKRSAGCDLASEAILQVSASRPRTRPRRRYRDRNALFRATRGLARCQGEDPHLVRGHDRRKSDEDAAEGRAGVKARESHGDRRRRDGARHRLCFGAGWDAGRSDRCVGRCRAEEPAIHCQECGARCRARTSARRLVCRCDRADPCNLFL